MIKLIAIVGTNSKRSTNRQLLQYMQKHFADKAEIELVEIKDIPVFNKPADKQVPEAVLEIVAKIEESDGVIIGTPEYDHSIPAVLMSALAWLSYGVFPLLNKPVMITGASYGTLGSSRAQLQLRQILNAPEIKANVLPDEFLLSHSLLSLIHILSFTSWSAYLSVPSVVLFSQRIRSIRWKPDQPSSDLFSST